ncbi:Tudor domain [Pristimantis euphronides]
MYKLSVLKVEDPSCFFCQILKEGCSTEYEQLFVELNSIYGRAYRDVEELKPASLPVGAFCVVFYEEMNRWCRAVLDSIVCSAHDELVECFLVDYAIFCPIKKTNIRFPVEEVNKLPFRAKKFRLRNIQPISLCINVIENTAEMRPAKRWDTAAIHCFQQLLDESLKIEAEIYTLKDSFMIVDLYITTVDTMICANDYLVAMKYACFENSNKTKNSEVTSPAPTLKNIRAPLYSSNPPTIPFWGDAYTAAFHPPLPCSAGHLAHLHLDRTQRIFPLDGTQRRGRRNAQINHEQKPNRTQEKPRTSDSNTRVESAPLQFVWPVWSRSDTRRRHSTEITEKSFGKLSPAGENKSALMPESIRKQDLARLLQFLNPTPGKLPEEEPKKSLKIINPERAIFVNKFLTPFSTLEEVFLCVEIKKLLIMRGYDGPNLTESYCWTPIAEGLDSIVISPDGSNPFYYIPPLLSFLSCASVVYKALPSRRGPHAVIICPGWKKAHSVYSLLIHLSKNIRPLNPMLLLVGLKKEETECIKFRRQCEVIVTTAQSFLRCLEHHGLFLLNLCHLVFDDVDVLFSKAGPEMSEILQFYKKTVSAANRDGSPQQIVAVGSKWIHDMQRLLQYTTTPRIVITNMEQAAVFTNVQQVIQLCLECEKMSMLLRCLDFTPVHTQKILIFTKNDEEAELVHKAVQTTSVYSLLLNKSLWHLFDHVLQQWRKPFGHRTVVVLVITDDYAPLSEITDATCIIHYSFPENVLGLRLFSLLDYIQGRIDKISMEEDDNLRAKSVLLMTNKHASFGINVLKSLQQAQATIPPELDALAQGLLQVCENKKQNKALCSHLKAFGYCNQDKHVCPHRHCINPLVDLPGGVAAIPESDQYITVLPLSIVDAARFFGRVVTKSDPYSKLSAELKEYYESPMNKDPAQKVQCKHLYAISEGSDYHRVQVLSTKIVGNVSYARVQYIDDGRTDEILVHELFLLPPAFQSVPPQFREFFVCRVKPFDNEDMWDPKVTRIITRSIRGKEHRAKVVLSLGKTYWLDPMLQVTILSDLSTCTYDLNVRTEILSTGLATDNPQHISKLKALLENSGCSQLSADREEENVVLPETSTDGTSISTPPYDSSISTPPCLETADFDSGNKVVSNNLSPHSDEEREELKEVTADDDSESLKTLLSTRFVIVLYPEVKWFETDDTVTLTVKLQPLTDPKCIFYSDKLVFSCEAGGKHYRADMELYKEIVREKSECRLKNGKAVISIRKRKLELWNKLLKHKHPNVSFDFDHLEDSEDSEGNKSGFNCTKKFYNVINEDLVSSEYSESESD